MKLLSWKTTACGLVMALAGFVMFSPETFAAWPVVLALAKYTLLGGFAALGIASKDSAVHSTQAEVTQATANQTAALQATATKTVDAAKSASVN